MGPWLERTEPAAKQDRITPVCGCSRGTESTQQAGGLTLPSRTNDCLWGAGGGVGGAMAGPGRQQRWEWLQQPGLQGSPRERSQGRGNPFLTSGGQEAGAPFCPSA